MKNYCYTCEINVKHPLVKLWLGKSLDTFDEYRDMLVSSRWFTELDAVKTAVEDDVAKKLRTIITLDNTAVISKLNEPNPFKTLTHEEMAERAEKSATFMDYLDSWDEDDGVENRVTCTTESLDLDSSGELIEMPMDNSQMVFRYNVFMFEDDIDVDDGYRFFVDGSGAVH